MASVIVASDILVASFETTGEERGFGQLLVGAIIVSIVGNAAENSRAISPCEEGQDGALDRHSSRIRHSDSAFVVLILVFAGIAMGQPFTLVSTLLELVTIFLAAIILNLIVHNWRTNWFEGVVMTAVYIIIAIAFFFVAY